MISGLTIDANLDMGLTYQTLNRKVAAGAAVLDSVDAEVQITSGYTTYTKYATVHIPNYAMHGTIRLSVQIKPDYVDQTAYIKWMKNDAISVGGEQTFNYVDGSTFGHLTEDIVVLPGDCIEWWMKNSANYFTYKEIRVLGAESADDAGAWDLT